MPGQPARDDGAQVDARAREPLALQEIGGEVSPAAQVRGGTQERVEPCEGRGHVKTAETVTYEIFREITRAVRQFDAQKLLVLAAPKVVGRILDEESAAVAELEEFTGKTIRFQAEEHYAQEQYDVVLL